MNAKWKRPEATGAADGGADDGAALDMRRLLARHALLFPYGAQSAYPALCAKFESFDVLQVFFKWIWTVTLCVQSG